jgi:hypothetical protein
MTSLRTALVALLLALAVAACDSLPLPTTEPPDPTTVAPATTATPTTTAATTPPTMPPSVPAGVCRSYEDPIVSGTVTDDAANEISGIVASRSFPDVLWMHNDSGGGPFVYATTVTGEPMGKFEVDTTTFDWEDIAIGPGSDPDRDYLYLGDIGDNLHFRPNVTVQRFREPRPDPAGGLVAEVEEFNLFYPDPGPDAEAMFVDPVTHDLVLVTKPASGGDAVIYRAPAEQLVDGASIDLIEIATFPLDRGLFVTGADIDATGAAILFRGYNEVWLWNRTDLDLTETFAGEPCSTPSTAEVQGEAITFAAGGLSYYTMSEGRDPDIHYVFSIFD